MIRNSQFLEVIKNTKFPLHAQNLLYTNPSPTVVSPNTDLKFPICNQFLPPTVLGVMYAQFPSRVHMENTGSVCIKNSKFARSKAEITSETHMSTSRSCCDISSVTTFYICLMSLQFCMNTIWFAARISVLWWNKKWSLIIINSGQGPLTSISIKGLAPPTRILPRRMPFQEQDPTDS